MSYSIIAPQALVGVPLPTSDEISDPMEFMKYVVKRHNIMEGIKRTNFFLNTQEPGLIFQTPDGSRFIGAAKLQGKSKHSGKHKMSMHARQIPPYVSSFDDPFVRSLPPPYGNILMGVNNNTFGPRAVVGPGGLVRNIAPINVDGTQPIGLVSSFGVKNYVPVNVLTRPYSGGIATVSPFPGAMPVPVAHPFMPGVFAISLEKKNTVKSLKEALEKALKDLEEATTKGEKSRIESLTKRVTELTESLIKATKEAEEAATKAEAAKAAGKAALGTPTTVSTSASTPLVIPERASGEDDKTYIRKLLEKINAWLAEGIPRGD